MDTLISFHRVGAVNVVSKQYPEAYWTSLRSDGLDVSFFHEDAAGAAAFLDSFCAAAVKAPVKAHDEAHDRLVSARREADDFRLRLGRLQDAVAVSLDDGERGDAIRGTARLKIALEASRKPLPAACTAGPVVHAEEE